MRIALHIFKKDLRRLWPLLCIMIAFIGLRLAALMRDLLTGNPPQIEPVSYLQTSGLFGPTGLEILIMLILVLLIHEEPLVGTSAFWLTRPIPRTSLIAAKGAFILLFLVAVPVAADFVVLFRYGLEANRIISVLLQVLSIHLVFIGSITAVAVLTGSIQAFVLALGAIMLFMPLCARFLHIDIPGTLTTVLCLVVILHQYLTRRTRRSVVIFIVGLLLTVPTADWAQITPSQRLTPAISAGIGKIGLVVRTQPETSLSYSGPLDPSKRQIFGAFDVVNIPRDDAVQLINMTGRLDFGGGNSLIMTKRASYAYGNALEGVLPGFGGAAESKTTRLVEFLSVSDEDFAKWGNQPCTCSGQAQFQLYHYAPIGTLPLSAGARLQIGSNLVAISRVDFDSDGLSVSLIGRRIGGENLVFYFLNRRLQMVLGSAHSSESATGRSLITHGANISYWVQTWGSKASQRSQPVDASWLEGAEVLVMERVEIGRFVRDFLINDFRMSENTLDQWQQRARRVH